MKIMQIACVLILLNTWSPPVRAEVSSSFHSRLGQSIVMDRTLLDEEDHLKTLSSLLADKPTLVALVYYSCRNVCEMFLKGTALSMARSGWLAGSDYHVLVISIDPLDKASLAQERKEQFITALRSSHHPISSVGLHFLRGDAETLDKVSQDLGLSFTKDKVSGEYSHPAALVFLSRTGKITDYLFGMNFSAKDMDDAFARAAENREGTLWNKFLIICAHYLPLEKPNSQHLMVWLRGLSLVFLALVPASILWYSTKRRSA